MSNQVLEQEDIEVKEEVKRPSKYLIVFYNDDVTPFDFVILVLISVLNKNEKEASALALAVHEQGEEVVARNYSLEVAKNKVSKIKKLCQQYQYPLKVEYKEQK